MQVAGQVRWQCHRKLLDLSTLSERQQHQPQAPDVSLLPGARGQRVLAEAHVTLLKDVLLTDVCQTLGQTVVCEPHVSPSVQQHAGRLQLLVHDGVSVQIVERAHQLDSVSPQLIDGHRSAARQQLRQTAAGDVFGQKIHHQTVVSLDAAQSLIVHQMRMTELQQRVQLALRTLDLRANSTCSSVLYPDRCFPTTLVCRGKSSKTSYLCKTLQ